MLQKPNMHDCVNSLPTALSLRQEAEQPLTFSLCICLAVRREEIIHVITTILSWPLNCISLIKNITVF